LLISLGQFVSLKIGKIEAICVTYWATGRGEAGLQGAIQSMPAVMPRPVPMMGEGRLRHWLPRFLKPPLIAGRIHDACRAATRKHRRVRAQDRSRHRRDRKRQLQGCFHA